MVLPQPQLPQSAHDVSIDNTASRPLSTAHSWTYPGFGCGALIRPQFTQSVLYSEAQSLGFDRVSHVSAVSGPLVAAAESEAAQMIRNNFIQPTVNALGYTLDRFTLSWARRLLTRPARRSAEKRQRFTLATCAGWTAARQCSR